MSKQWLQRALSLAIGIFCSLNIYPIYEAYRDRADYLYWDPAAHAYDGVRIAVDVQRLNPLGLLRDTNNQVLWPPLHSYLQLPFHALFGLNFYASSVCSLVFLALFFVAVTWLYQQRNDDWSGWLALMVMVATSPYYLGYGSIPMLEIFGAVFAAISFTLYLKESPWFPLSLALLFFLKYNYCLYVLLPVGAIKWIEAREFLLAKVRGKKIFPPFRIFLCAAILFLLWIEISGGFSVGPWPVHGIGNLMTILFWIIFLRALLTGQIGKGWRRIRGTGWDWFLLPVFMWILIPVPNRIKTLLSFSINKPLSGLSPADLSYYTFYFKAMPVYFMNLSLMAACLIGAAVLLQLYRKERELLFLALAFLLPLLLMTLNQNKQERFLFTFVFPLWVLFACAVARIHSKFIRVAVALGVLTLGVLTYDEGRVERVVSWPFIPAKARTAVHFIMNEVKAAREIRVLGANNELSRALIQYHVSKASSFSPDQHFLWELESHPPESTEVIAINCEGSGTLVKERKIPGGLQIRHYRVESVGASH